MFYNESHIAQFNQVIFEFLIVEQSNHRLNITLNRPEKKNAMNQTLVNELAFALAYAKYSKSVWLVIIKANGTVFCAGADLNNFLQPQDSVISTIPQPLQTVKLGDAFAQVYKPVIAQVHASVYAGGFLILGGCTQVIATENAQFSLPEVKRGIWPFQVMASLQSIVPARQLIDWCMRGHVLNAEQAQQMGIVSKVVKEEELAKAVDQLAQEIEDVAPMAIQKGLEAYHTALNLNQADKHSYLQAMLQDLLQSNDAKEGILAFKEKRKPLWNNQ
jgi:methylglutaconyl-CoA hydratase